METKCQVCGFEGGNMASLHRHLKKDHHSSPQEYYPLFFERKDLFDGEPIEFKDFRQYFVPDFNSKSNFLKWIAPGGIAVKKYILDILEKRCREKETNLIPSHVELKSLFAPSLSDYISIFGGVNKFKAALDEKEIVMKLEVGDFDMKAGEMEILIDTREQAPISFKSSIVKKLIVGDYCPSEDFFCNLFVERKSMFDLAGTLTKGLERFEKEVERAAQLGAYLVVVTDSSYLDALDYSPKNSFSQRIGGAYLFNKIRELMRANKNIQFVFSNNRAKSALLIEKIFRMGESAKTMDLEFLKDRGFL